MYRGYLRVAGGLRERTGACGLHSARDFCRFLYNPRGICSLSFLTVVASTGGSIQVEMCCLGRVSACGVKFGATHARKSVCWVSPLLNLLLDPTNQNPKASQRTRKRRVSIEGFQPPTPMFKAP